MSKIVDLAISAIQSGFEPGAVAAVSKRYREGYHPTTPAEVGNDPWIDVTLAKRDGEISDDDYDILRRLVRPRIS